MEFISQSEIGINSVEKIEFLFYFLAKIFEYAAFPPLRHTFVPRSGHVGFCDGASDTGEGFLGVLQFPLPSHSAYSSLFINRPIIQH
jgi:hypothetical protein